MTRESRGSVISFMFIRLLLDTLFLISFCDEKTQTRANRPTKRSTPMYVHC